MTQLLRQGDGQGVQEVLANDTAGEAWGDPEAEPVGE
jgi:hypothetical protein